MRFTGWLEPPEYCSRNEQNLGSKNMKKLLILGSIALVLGSAVLLSGPNTSQSFINGVSVVIEQPASGTALSVSGTSTAIKYTNDLSQLVTAGTNAAGITFGAWTRPVVVRSDALGQVAPGAVSVTLPAGTTNLVTLTFQRSADGVNYDAGTTWSFATLEDSALTGQTMVTNVPSWFLTGASLLRLRTMSFATNSFGYTNAITSVKFVTAAP